MAKEFGLKMRFGHIIGAIAGVVVAIPAVVEATKWYAKRKESDYGMETQAKSWRNPFYKPGSRTHKRGSKEEREAYEAYVRKVNEGREKSRKQRLRGKYNGEKHAGNITVCDSCGNYFRLGERYCPRCDEPAYPGVPRR